MSVHRPSLSTITVELIDRIAEAMKQNKSIHNVCLITAITHDVPVYLIT